MIKPREYGLRTFKDCLVGSHLVEWLDSTEVSASRAEAVDLGKQMQAFGFLTHVCDDHAFEDDYLFYRFYVDGLETGDGYQDFTSLEEGLAFLGHINLDRGEVTPWDSPDGKPSPPSYILPSVPAATPQWTPGDVSPAGPAPPPRTAAAAVPRPDAAGSRPEEFGGFGASPGGFGGTTPGGLNVQAWNLEDGFSFGESDPRLLPGYRKRESVSVFAEVDSPSRAPARKGKGAAGQGSGGPAVGPPSEEFGGFGVPPTSPQSEQGAATDLDGEAWYHGDLERDQTLKKFAGENLRDGAWLVRRFRKRAGWYVLSMCFKKEVFHMVVHKTAPLQPGFATKGYSIDDGPVFSSVAELIEFYQADSHRTSEVPTALGPPVLR